MNDKEQTPVIRMFGVNENQNSVMVHVHDFVSYFWVECPPQLNPTQDNLEMIRQALNVL